MQYLKIENPGVCPSEGFTLLGASTKRGSEAIGKFGSGNKHGVNVCLRHNLNPIIFCSNLKMEFDTKTKSMSGQTFNQVYVKYGGKDDNGKNCSSTQDLGYVLEYGATDWLSVDLALREFVSNAIDQTVQEEEVNFLNMQRMLGLDLDDRVAVKEKLGQFRKDRKNFDGTVIEIVGEGEVRAKKGYTRVFIPLNNDVRAFYANLGKWFLHFSEPHLIGQSILPKADRNIGDSKSAVIYRRGVRVREFRTSTVPSLFDYNLEGLELNESRQVDDFYVQHYAGMALTKSDKKYIGRLLQSFTEGQKFWEHSFSDYAIDNGMNSPEVKQRWEETFESLLGDKAVAVIAGNGGKVRNKGYEPIVIPETFMGAIRKTKIKVSETVLTKDENEGKVVLEPDSAMVTAVDTIWSTLESLNLTKGKDKPKVKGFTTVMAEGGIVLGYYRDNTVFLNNTASSNPMTPQFAQTVLEELSHHTTGSPDECRDFQDYAFAVAAQLMLRTS